MVFTVSRPFASGNRTHIVVIRDRVGYIPPWAGFFPLERGPAQAVLPLVGLTADNIFRDRHISGGRIRSGGTRPGASRPPVGRTHRGPSHPRPAYRPPITPRDDANQLVPVWSLYVWSLYPTPCFAP
ncbi:MAG: hypothetical protein R6U98_36835 [Pirellulaceae bacterium]